MCFVCPNGFYQYVLSTPDITYGGFESAHLLCGASDLTVVNRYVLVLLNVTSIRSSLSVAQLRAASSSLSVKTVCVKIKGNNWERRKTG